MDPDEIIKALGLKAQASQTPNTPQESIDGYKKYITKQRDEALEHAAKCDAVLKYIEEHSDCGMLIHLVKEL